jgi:hypothetical protein
MTWALKIGISLFLPMAVIGCAVREWSRCAASRAKIVAPAALGGMRARGSAPRAGVRKRLKAAVAAVWAWWTPRAGLCQCAPPSLAVIPLHYTSSSANARLLEDANGNPSKLIRLTIAAVPDRSPIFWCGAHAQLRRRSEPGALLARLQSKSGAVPAQSKP